MGAFSAAVVSHGAAVVAAVAGFVVGTVTVMVLGIHTPLVGVELQCSGSPSPVGSDQQYCRHMNVWATSAY